ncbi:galactose oxidase [Spirosoma jeollabukense]
MTFHRYIYTLFARICLPVAAMCLWLPSGLNAQSYGLHFVGHEDIQDSRTSLDLSSERPLCLRGKVDLTFDMALMPNYQTYFGYIFRMIQDEKQNLDLLYDQKSKCFKIILGERFSQSVIRLDSTHLFNQWNQFRIQLDLPHKTLLVFVNNKLVVSDKLYFKEAGCFKVFFGSNEFREFKSTDLPPMNLKDISLYEDDQRKYYWPLREIDGTTAKDEITGQIASVKNPVWIKSLHNDWKLTDQFTIKGYANVAFDPTSETIYVVGSDELYQYAVQKRQGNRLPHKIYPTNLFRGSQAVYNPITGKLYNFFVDQKAVAVYDPVTGNWSNESISPNHVQVTEYWHANKFIARADSSLYVLGGYGQLTYKNSILRYHFNTRRWDTLAVGKDVYTPRYLAALGTSFTKDTIYMMGGYGSITGEQMLNPKNSYDLLQYVVKKNEFRKLYELNVPKTDFAFANSLVIEPKTNQYYGLIFPNHQFKSHLQLIRGSLAKPTYDVIGNPIPYSFHDIHSYADLYYCPISQKLIVVTLYQNEANHSTDVKLFSISFPPNLLEVQSAEEESYPINYVWLALATLVAGAGIFLYIRRSRRPAGDQQPEPYQPDIPRAVLQNANPEQVTPEVIGLQAVTLATKPLPLPSSIFFFGNFQVLDHTGYDITKAFTPLLKELFLLLALNSIGKHRGVPSQKLNEILWPDKSERDAGNNRSVNITKLRNLLEKVAFCSLSKESGYWKIEFDFSQLYVDYECYSAIIEDKVPLTKQTIIELGKITKRGSFLQNTEYPWLDDFKADISNKLINTFLKYVDTLPVSEDPEFLIQITTFIFDYDPVNEDAIILRCKALALMGKHTLAKNTFEKFVRDYKAIYGEDYEQSFSTIID